MTEQVTCHEFTGVIWQCSTTESDLVLCPEGYCPTCGTKLLADGTTQAMVPAVTPDAVKATWLFRLLDYAAKHNPFDPEKVTHLDVFGDEMPEAYPQYDSEIWSFGDVALVHIHWGDYDEPLIVAIEGLTDEGRTIHAALQQARGHLTMTQQDLSQYDDGTGDADLREGLRRCREVNGQALASLASGEPTTDDASRTAESE